MIGPVSSIERALRRRAGKNGLGYLATACGNGRFPAGGPNPRCNEACRIGLDAAIRRSVQYQWPSIHLAPSPFHRCFRGLAVRRYSEGVPVVS